MSFFIMSQPAQASGSVTSGTSTADFSTAGFIGSTSESSCRAFLDAYTNAAFTYEITSVVPATTPPPVNGVCYYKTAHLTIVPIYYSDGYVGIVNHVTTTSGCPANSTGTTSCTCNSGFVPNAAATSCVLAACSIPHAHGTPCVCDDGYKFDTAGTSCVPEVACPVDPLPPLPANDLCAQSLEKGAGEDVNKACPDLTDEMKKQAQCVYDKIWKLSPPISYSKPSATIRNEAYQKHLVDVWNKLKEIKGKDLSNAQKQACAAVITHVEQHGIKSPPSKKGGGAPHVNGKAIDIPEDVTEAMMRQVATFITMPKPPSCLPCNDVITIIGDVQDYVNSASENPPACNLRWGGRFTPYDPVHFQLP